MWLLKNGQSEYKPEFQKHLLVNEIVQPIYDKFREHASRSGIEFEIKKTFPDDFSVRADKEGIGLILTPILQRSFLQTKSLENIDIVLSLKDIDEDWKELEISISQFNVISRDLGSLFEPN
jgi:hypothetical protein